MYESEANGQIDLGHGIPADVIQRFGELSGSVLARTTLPWSEHCTECVWPTCYSTCDLYSAREDGRCRRFAEGMVRVDCPTATNSYLLKIQFKRWGQAVVAGKPAPGFSRTSREDGEKRLPYWNHSVQLASAFKSEVGRDRHALQVKEESCEPASNDR